MYNFFFIQVSEKDKLKIKADQSIPHSWTRLQSQHFGVRRTVVTAMFLQALVANKMSKQVRQGIAIDFSNFPNVD